MPTMSAQQPVIYANAQVRGQLRAWKTQLDKRYREFDRVFAPLYEGKGPLTQHVSDLIGRKSTKGRQRAFEKLHRAFGPGVTLESKDLEQPLTYALGEAQRARFEYGECAKPRPYTPPSPTHKVSVYVAGAIFSDDDPNDDPDGDLADYSDDGRLNLDPWRQGIFECDPAKCSFSPGPQIGRFVYCGPTIVEDHGRFIETLARDCLTEVARTDTLFAWIDRYETIGTVAEIGAAHARGKPTFVAFADASLAEHFYFAKQLATVAVIAADAVAAWRLFAQWQDHSAP
jgi:hypothetical protein